MADQVQCGSCQGKGYVLVPRHSTVEPGVPTEYEQQPCGTCGGTGWVNQ
jgi:DnaJ-class molecular chaperone